MKRMKCLAVIRQLPGSRPVMHELLLPPDDHDSMEQSEIDHYFNEKADESIEKFVKEFPEFEKAKWYRDYIWSH